MENPPTKMQQAAPDGTHIGDEPLLTSGTSKERLPAWADRYYLTETDKTEMGIREDEVYTWVRIERFWEDKEGLSRQLQYTQEHPGARVPLDKLKRPRTNDDLILMTSSRAQQEEQEAMQQAAYEAWVEEIESGRHEEPLDGDGHPMDDRDYLRGRARRLRDQNRKSGITGNTPTSGQRLEDVYNRMTYEEIEKEEARYRSGARRTPFRQEDWGTFLEGARSGGPQNKARGKVTAMGDSGFARKPLNISQKGKG